MTGYNKTFAKTTGQVVEVTDLGTEADNLEAAFHNVSGHSHSGSSAEGPVIGLIGDAGAISPLNKVVIDTSNDRIGFFVDVSSSSVEQIRIQDGAILPVTDSDVDIGTTDIRFKDAYIDTITVTTSLTIGGTAAATVDTNWAASDIVSGTLDDARVAETNVTQHEAALSITESQISDLQSYLLPADIGTSVQAYDADTVKYDAATANFTGILQSKGVNVATLGANTFDGDQIINSITPRTFYIETDASVDSSIWSVQADVEQFIIYAFNDATTFAEAALIIDRSGANIDTVNFPNGTLQYGGVEVATLNTNWVTTDITSGTFADARIAESNVTQHQGALTITESQISDLGSYIGAAGVTYEQLNANGDVGTSAGQLAIGNHTHTGVYEPADAAIAKTDEAANFTAGLQVDGEDVATTADIAAYRGCVAAPGAAGTSISHNASSVLPLSYEWDDTDNIHDNVTNNSRFTVPAGVTKVRIRASVSFASNATGIRAVSVRKNGGPLSPPVQGYTSAGDGTYPTTFSIGSPVISVTAGDFFDFAVLQTSGAALNLLGAADANSSWFEMEIIE